MISIPIDKIKNIVDSTSNARRGNVEKLPMGSTSYFATDKPVLASNINSGTTIFSPEFIMSSKRGPFPSANFRVDTFIVSVRRKIPYTNMAYLDLEMDKLANQFAVQETTEVLRRIKAVDDVVYAQEDEVERLQKFFDDLKRPVAVLKTGQIVDMGDDFTLVVRTEPCAEVFDEPMNQSITVALWEDVGFFCHVNY